ncbi:MAG TPA: fibronectin type III domain-containing protein [bacterium]|nr:fibronectin type III domain-containing protein [bacterium]
MRFRGSFELSDARPRSLAAIAAVLVVLAGAPWAHSAAEAQAVGTSGTPAIEPAVITSLADTPHDAGTSIDIEWKLSPTETESPGTVIEYRIMRADSPTGEFTEVGSVPATTNAFSDGSTQPGKQYWYRIDTMSIAASVASQAAGPGVSIMQWYNGRSNVLFLVLFSCAAILVYIWIAKRKKGQVFVRRIPALDAVDEAIGRATEMGKPILYIPGGLDVDDPQTIASMNILSRVADRVATYGSRLMLPCNKAMQMSMARETVKESYLRVGKPDDFKEEDIRYLTDDQFGYVAGVDGIMMRERPAANFYLGAFYAESLILAETGFATGAIQIAGTAMIDQLPFFVAACDYTLIGEELYAAGATLSQDPVQLGTIKGQDVAKALFMALIIAGVIFSLTGHTFFYNLFTIK